MFKPTTTIGCLAMLLCSIVAASDSPYRLAGIITPDSGRNMAIIEAPDKEQQLLRVGDAIDDGLVAEITANSVRLEFPHEDVTLRLEGSEEPGTFLPGQYAQDEYSVINNIKSMSINAQTLDEIRQLSSSAESAESKDVVSEVLRHLDLPAEARIIAINDEQVTSPAEALQEMATSIDDKASEGLPFKLVISVAATDGNTRVYVFADESGYITDQTIGSN